MDPKHLRDFAPWRSGATTRRAFRRWAVRVQATFRTSGRSFACVAHDLSPGGARIEVAGRTRVKVGAATAFDLAAYGRIPAEVRHISGNKLGLMFTHDGEHQAALARFLVTRPPPRPQTRKLVKAAGSLSLKGRRVLCHVLDLSRFGARVRVDTANDFKEEQEIVFRIDGHGSVPAIVRRVLDNEIGLVLVEAFAGNPGGAARKIAG